METKNYFVSPVKSFLTLGLVAVLLTGCAEEVTTTVDKPQ